MNTQQKILFSLIVFFFISGIALIFQNKSNLGSLTAITARVIAGAESATSSPVYLTTAAASSTFPFYLDNAKEAYANIIFTASSSASVLAWTYEFSDDNQTWFGEDASTNAGNVTTTHGSTNVYHIWTPGGAVVTSRTFALPGINAKYARITVKSLGAAGSIWAKVNIKQEIQ